MDITTINEMTSLNRVGVFLYGLVWLGWVGSLISGCFTIFYYFLFSIYLFASRCWIGFLFLSFLYFFLLHFYHRKINNSRGWFIRHSMEHNINCGELKGQVGGKACVSIKYAIWSKRWCFLYVYFLTFHISLEAIWSVLFILVFSCLRYCCTTLLFIIPISFCSFYYSRPDFVLISMAVYQGKGEGGFLHLSFIP